MNCDPWDNSQTFWDNLGTTLGPYGDYIVTIDEAYPEVEFVHAVSAGGSVKFLAAV